MGIRLRTTGNPHRRLARAMLSVALAATALLWVTRAYAAPSACDACTQDCRQSASLCRDGCSGDASCLASCERAYTSCMGDCN